MSVQSTDYRSSSKPSFREETIRVVIPLRSAVVELMKFHPVPIMRSRDVQEHFGLNTKLSWQVYRLLHATDTLELCMDIPPHGAMRNFLQTVEKRIANVPRENLLAAEKAYEVFEQHVERYAGDRTRFDTMVVRLLGGSADGQIELAHRRSVFEAYRYFMGIEIGTVLNTTIMYPGASKGCIASFAELRLRRRVWRLSAEAPLVLDKIQILHPLPEAKIQASNVRPIDEKAFERYGIPIIPEFCSTPDLQLKHTTDAEGIKTTEWLQDGVGQCEAIDVAMGNTHDFSADEMVDQRLNARLNSRRTRCGTPAQLLVWDFLIHRPTFGKMEASLSRTEPSTTSGPQVNSREDLTLPPLGFREKVSYLGTGAGAAYTSEVPQYTDFLRYVCDSQKWNLDELDVYRVRIDYPLIHTVMTADFQVERL